MNKADTRRLDIIHRLPCMACVQDGCSTGQKVEAHHLVDKGYRKHSGGHQATIPLCGWHHRGEPPMDFSVAYMHATRGPSLFHHKKEFVARYGNERELLANIDKVING